MSRSTRLFTDRDTASSRLPVRSSCIMLDFFKHQLNVDSRVCTHIYTHIGPHLHTKSSGAKQVMRQIKKIQFLLVFACNVLALCYVKIFLRKPSYKAGCGRFAISVLLQNGISDSDVFPQNGLCSPRTGTATAPARAPMLRHGQLLKPSRCQFERRHSRIDWTVSKFVSHKSNG